MAALGGTELVSQGGLPEPSPVPESGMANPFLGAAAHRDGLSSRILNREMGPGRGMTRPPRLAARPGPDGPGMDRFFGGLGYMLMQAFFIDSGPHFVAGFVKIRPDTVPEGEAKPCGGAYVHFGKTWSLSRGGQILTRTGPFGGYILASFLTEELVRDGGCITAQDPDFGVFGTSATNYCGPGGVYGSYHHASTIRLVVTPREMQDRVAPYVEMGFEVREPSGRLVARDFAKPGEELYLRVAVRDNATTNADAFGMDVTIGAAKAAGCGANVCESRPWREHAEGWETPVVERGLTVYRIRLKDLAEGRHAVSVTVADAACNQRSVTGEVVIASFPSCSDADAQVPPEASLEVGEDPLLVSPGVLPKLVFTQTMKMTGMANLKLEKKVEGNWEAVPGKVLGPKGDLTRFPVESLCQVILRPAGLLQAGQTYRLSWTSALRSTADVALVPGSREFTISKVKPGPTYAVAGWGVTHVAVYGQRVFAVLRQPGTDVWSLGEFEIEGDRLRQNGRLFGPFQGTFRLQGVNAMAVFENVPVPDGKPETLLLVTTSPQLGRPELNGVLWAFVVCPEPDLGRNVGDLRFAVSLGPGSNGYSPTVDQVNGVIVVPRLVGSTLLISVEKAIEGWSENMAGQATSALGANQLAILQPFYMANPVDRAMDFTMSPGTAWAAALLPTVPGSGSATVDVLMGYSQLAPEGQVQSGTELRGMPVWRKAYDGDKWKAEPPYVGPDGYGMASIRSIRGPATVLAGGTRVAVVPGIRVTVEGQEYETNLALGTVNGGVAGTSGKTHLAIVDERDPANPVHLADWPTTDILGPGVTFEVRRKVPSVDPKTKLVAVSVTASGAQGPYTWFILDLKTPKTPQIVAKIENAGYAGSLWDGQFVTNTNSGIAVHYLPEVLAPRVHARRAETAKMQGLNATQTRVRMQESISVEEMQRAMMATICGSSPSGDDRREFKVVVVIDGMQWNRIKTKNKLIEIPWAYERFKNELISAGSNSRYRVVYKEIINKSNAIPGDGITYDMWEQLANNQVYKNADMLIILAHGVFFRPVFESRFDDLGNRIGPIESVKGKDITIDADTDMNKILFGMAYPNLNQYVYSENVVLKHVNNPLDVKSVLWRWPQVDMAPMPSQIHPDGYRMSDILCRQLYFGVCKGDRILKTWNPCFNKKDDNPLKIIALNNEYAYNSKYSENPQAYNNVGKVWDGAFVNSLHFAVIELLQGRCSINEMPTIVKSRYAEYINANPRSVGSPKLGVYNIDFIRPGRAQQ